MPNMLPGCYITFRISGGNRKGTYTGRRDAYGNYLITVINGYRKQTWAVNPMAVLESNAG